MLPTPSLNGHGPQSDPLPAGPRFTVPSPNGDNGPVTADPPSPNGANGRDGRGRFARGNKGGSGNPFARRVARLRHLLLEVVSEDDLRDVLRQLVGRAKAGDLAAAKLLLGYLVGRPVETVDPDRLDLEEWRLYQECPTVAEVVDGQPRKFDPAAACALARVSQNQNLDQLLTLVHQRLEAANG